MLFATTGYVMLPSSVVWANPTGEQVVGGAATFHRDGKNLTVNQSTDRLAVNWQDFSIAAGERTHFNMPSAASIALNRVLGGNPSQIYGTLSSNGNIILVNNAGIFVGPGGTINAASFVGSTLDIDPGQFMAGGAGKGMHLTGDSYAPIVNQGNITADKGDVFLIAQKVENRGTISAQNGRAALVGPGRAADRTEVVLHEVGGSGFAVRIAQLEGEAAQGLDGDLPDGEELLNEGTISAAHAEMVASGNIYAAAIKNSGTIRAKAVVAQADGTVRLDGGLGDVQNTGTLIAKNAGEEATAAGGQIEVVGQNVTATPESIITAAGGAQGGDGGRVKIDSQDTTIVQGKVDVSAPAAQAKGGKAELLGERVGLFDGAKVDASGGAGGGTVLVGGDYLGGGAPLPELRDKVKLEDGPVKNAKATVMAETAEIKADATVNGDGGKIILWSDEYTGFYGELFARGGLAGGDGGFVETSSKNNLQAFGGVDVRAPFGHGGLWLLDPFDITISTTGTNPIPNSFTSSANNTTIENTAVNDALALGDVILVTGSGSVNPQEDGNIAVNAPIDGGGFGNSLTLSAIGDVSVSAGISGVQGLTLRSTLDGDIVVDAPIVADGSVSFTTLSGDIDIDSSVTAGTFVTLQSASGDLSIGSGTITAGTSISLQTTSGNLSVGSRINGAGYTIQAGSFIDFRTTSGNIESAGSMLAAGGIVFRAPSGTIELTGGGLQNISSGLSVSGIDLRGNGDITLNGFLSNLGSSTGGTIIVDSDGGSISGTAQIFLEDPNVAAGSSLGLQAAQDIQVFVTAPLVSQLSIAPWDPAAAGPLIGANAIGGDLTIQNFGVAGSAIVPGVVANLRGFVAGGDISIEGGSGNIVLGLERVIAGGNFVARTAEPTAGVIFAAPSDRFTAAVASTGSQTYDGRVTLHTAPELPPTAPVGSVALTTLLANGIVFTGSVNDGSVHNPAVPTPNLAPTQREGLLLLNTGATQFRDYVGTARTSTDGLGQIVHLGPLYQFRQEGGSVQFFATGTAPVPGGLGSLLGPSLYVADNPTNPNLPGGGSITFDGANIVIYANTYVTGQSDILFEGTVNGAFRDQPSLFVVNTIDPTPLDPGGGQIVFEGAVGGTVAIGGFIVNAVGFRNLDNDPTGFSQLKDAQIAINGNVTTFPGVNPLQPGTFGQVVLRADGAIVLAGTIDTRGGLSDPTILSGDVQMVAGLRRAAPENTVQLEGSILTRGGKVTFGDGITARTGNVFITGPSSIDTYADNAQGVVTFHGNVNGDPGSQININVGSAPLHFLGTNNGYSIGDISPFGLSVDSSGSINFAGNIRMGGNFLFNNLSGNFNSSVNFDGNYDLTINPIIPESDLVLQTLGGLIALRSLTVATSTTPLKLNGNISTSGAVSIGAPVELQTDLTIDTTGLSSNGGRISFNNTVTGANGNQSLTLRAGNNSIGVGNQIGRLLTDATKGLKDLVVESVASFQLGSNASIDVSGKVDIRGNFTTNEQVATQTAQRVVIKAGTDVLISGSITTRPFYGEGGDVILKAEGGFIRIGGAVDTRGRSGTFTGFTPDGSGTFTFATTGYKAGDVTLSAKDSIEIASILATGSNNFVTGGSGGEGGGIRVETTDANQGLIRIAAIDTSGGTDGDLGGKGGNISITRGGRTATVADPDAIFVGSMTARGGDSDSGVGADGGSISITALRGNLKAPTTFFVAGGRGSSIGTGTDRLPAGKGGTVTLTAPGEVGVQAEKSGNIYFLNSGLNLDGDGSLSVAAGRSIILVTQPNFSKPDSSSGGVVLTLNQDAPQFDSRGSMAFAFGTLGGQFFMPSSAYLVSNGGLVQIDNLGSISGGNGAITVSGITTSADNANGGQVRINQSPSAVLGAVTVRNAIETNGGLPTQPRYGRQGGSVFIAGTDITLNRIVTSGSDSLATATVPAFGGAAGDIQIRSTGTITLRRNLLAVGGNGLAATGRDATGGSGGTLEILGNLTLNTEDATRTAVIIDTRGGSAQGDGDAGQGGDVIWGRQASGTAVVLNGTQGASNTLDLRYGSGNVSLGTALADRGSTSPDQINLNTLITAADEAGSTGLLQIHARFGDPANANSQPGLTSLTTYARGYSVELLGGGTIVNSTRFLNTGYVRIGADANTESFFTGGLEAAATTAQPTAPYQVRLAGKINVGSAEDTGSGAAMILDEALLVGDTQLDSNGGNISMGTLDGGFDLILLPGIAGGTVTITGQVGRTTALDMIQIKNVGDAIMTNTLKFGDSVRAAQLVLDDGYSDAAGTVGASVNLGGNLTLTGGGSFGLYSSVLFDSTAAMVFSAGGLTTMEGQLTFANAALTLSSSSALGIFNLADTGTLDGSQNLILSGAGTKSFAGAVGSQTPVGTGTGYAITMSGGDVTFGSLTTAGGLYASGKVIFTGLATLAAGNQGSNLVGNTEFSGATLTSSGDVVLGDSSADEIVVRPGISYLTGTGNYTLNGTVTGEGSLVLGGSGSKSFENGLALSDLTQADASGLVTLKGAVSLTGDADLQGSVVLGGATLSVAGTATLGNNSADLITVNSSGVTFGGDGSYAINGKVTGPQTIALEGVGTKTFASTADVAGFTQGDASGRVVFQGNVTTSGSSTFASLVSLNGITFSTAGGITRFGTGAGDILSLSGSRVTLGGDGDYILNDVSGVGSVLDLKGGGGKSFGEIVNVVGFTQNGGQAAFQKDVITSGNSTFNGTVVLGKSFTAANNQSQTTFHALNLSDAVTLGGLGAYTVNGAVGGGNNLTLAGGGIKTFQSSMTVGSFGQTGGQVRLGGNVIAGGAVNLASVSTLRALSINTDGLADFDQTYGTLGLGGNFTTQAGGGTVAYTTVTGTGNLNTTAGAMVLNGVIENRGNFTATRAGDIILGNTTGAFLSDLDAIQSSGTIGFTAEGGSIVAAGISTPNALTLTASGPGASIGVADVSTPKTLTLNAADGDVLFDAGFPSRVGTLSFSAQRVENLQDGVVAGGFGNLTLAESLSEPLTLSSAGNLILSGQISIPGTLYLEAAGTVVNSGSANPFAPGSTVIISSPDLFSRNLMGPFFQNARYVQGIAPNPALATTRGTRVTTAGSTEGSVTVYFQNTDNFQPYSSQFTTGTGQPYTLASQENAVPSVMLPATVAIEGAFPSRDSYSAEELEMMTPEERSDYEAGQRRQSARVILERQPGQAEVGMPADGDVPQAKVPAPSRPAPTARVILDGKPLAEKTDKDKSDSTQLLRIRPVKVVALRSEVNRHDLIESERLAAEVNVGSAPVARR